MFRGRSGEGAYRACTTLPLLFAATGAVLLLVVGAPGVAAKLSALGLATAGAAAFAWQGRRLRRDPARLAPEAGRDAEAARMSERCAVAAPVWIRQIETARDTGDTQVAQLSRVFGDLVVKLDRVMGSAAAGGSTQEDAVAALAGNGAELDGLVAALRSQQEGKQRVVGQIGHAATRLKDSAAEVREVALLTRMVSLNATIEAARAGEAGRAFGVVVADMRELAARTASASEQFSRQTDALHRLVNGAFDEQAAGTGSIGWAQQLVQKVIADVEAVVVQLTMSISALAQERRDVRNDISQVLVALQFQDRVSQILAHVSGNLRELLAARAEGAVAGDAEWLQRIAQAYSTPEEFGNLDAAPRQHGAPVQEITYF